MGLKLDTIAECRAIQKRVIQDLERVLGISEAYQATVHAARCLDALDRIAKELTEQRRMAE